MFLETQQNPLSNLRFYKVSKPYAFDDWIASHDSSDHSTMDRRHSNHHYPDSKARNDNFNDASPQMYFNCFGQLLDTYEAEDDMVFVPLTELERHGVKVYTRDVYESLVFEELER